MSKWVNVGRPGPFGNPFKLNNRAENIRSHRHWIWLPEQAPLRRRCRLELRGKKLFCPGCRGTLPCHKTVLEEVALTCCDGMWEHEADCLPVLNPPLTTAPRTSADDTGPAFVYLLHFWSKIWHMQHYTGATRNLRQRLKTHYMGKGGARLMVKLKQEHIDFTVARLWTFPNWTAALQHEREIKVRGNAKELCPICRSLVQP